MTQSLPDSDALRRTALASSWRRSRGVARRRLWWRWTLWALPRVLAPLGAAAALAWLALRWLEPGPAAVPAVPAAIAQPQTRAPLPAPLPAPDVHGAPRPEAAPAASPAMPASAAVLLRLDLTPPPSATTPTNPPGDMPR